MHQHVLNPILQRHGARVARATRAPQLEQDLPVAEAAELDVAAILLYRRPDACVQQLPNHADNLAVLLPESHTLALSLLPRPRPLRPGPVLRLAALDRVHNRLARRDGLGDEAEDLGLDVRPRRVRPLRHGYEVRPVEDGGDAVDVHEPRCQWRRVRRRHRRPRREILQEGRRERLGQDAVVGDEF